MTATPVRVAGRRVRGWHFNCAYVIYRLLLNRLCQKSQVYWSGNCFSSQVQYVLSAEEGRKRRLGLPRAENLGEFTIRSLEIKVSHFRAKSKAVRRLTKGPAAKAAKRNRAKPDTGLKTSV